MLRRNRCGGWVVPGKRGFKVGCATRNLQRNDVDLTIHLD